MTHSTLWLAQTQFFTSLGFMLLFMALELGLAWSLLFFRLKSWRSGHVGWIDAYRFWVRVFALAFVLSFAAGMGTLVQFGSLWPGLMARAGDVVGPLLALVVVTTFLFKAGFLGAMLFGARRMAAPLHTAAVALVALGSTISAFFLVTLVAWAHVPVGALQTNGQYRVLDAWQVVFNPAMPWYVALFGSIGAVTVGFLMVGVVADQARRHAAGVSCRFVLKTGLALVAAGLVVQLVALGGTVRLAAVHQPAKAAALAGYWDSGSPPDLLLAGWPDTRTASNRAAWVWPGQAKVMLQPDAQGAWRGLDQFSGMAPPVALTFWSLRIMMILVVLMALAAGLTWRRAGRHHYDPAALSRRHQGILRWMAPSGALLLACGLAYVQAGAFPYAIYGTVTLSEILTTAPAGELVFGNLLFGLCHGLLFAGFVLLLRHVARYGVIPVSRHRRYA